MRAILVVMVLVAAGLAGCSGPGDDGQDGTSTTTSGSTTPSTTSSGSSSSSSTTTTSSSPEPTTHDVDIKNFAFNPPDLTVKVGDTVRWTNRDSVTHTATSDDGTTFDSGNLGNGAEFRFTFTEAGTFTYHCARHPSMTATITVEA